MDKKLILFVGTIFAVYLVVFVSFFETNFGRIKLYIGWEKFKYYEEKFILNKKIVKFLKKFKIFKKIQNFQKKFKIFKKNPKFRKNQNLQKKLKLNLSKKN